MAKILGAHHTSFTVADLERSVAFFRDVLGFELLFTREVRQEYFDRIVGLPGCVVRVALFRIPGGGHHVELFQYLAPRGEPHRPRPCDPGSTHLSLLVDDLAGLVGELRSRGAVLAGEPVLINAGPNEGGLAMYLQDPNGVLVELFQPPARATP